jgi:hypothetical protein
VAMILTIASSEFQETWLSQVNWIKTYFFYWNLESKAVQNCAGNS